jgi:hypothetical protein
MVARVVAILTWVGLLARLGSAEALGAALPPPRAVRVTTTETTERVVLPHTRGPLQLAVDAMAQTIRLQVSGDDPAALRAHLEKNLGAICPTSRVVDGEVVLQCRSRRFDAQLVTAGDRRYLDINELRGMPWRTGLDGPVSYHFEPWRSGLGQACPGVSEAAQGECELKAGHRLVAAMHFRAALETAGRQVACLRLGDLALGIGDPAVALGWYERVGGVGAFGRVATARICEINGSCLGTTASVAEIFNPQGLPEPLRAELLMRSARVETYMGRTSAAIDIMTRQSRAQGLASICRENGEILCRRIVLAGLRESEARRGKPTAEEAARDDGLIELYLNLPGWDKGPFALEMGQAAAPVIARAGATMFAGNLLSALAPQVPPARLGEHLLLTTETFLAGQNWARARLVVEYAETRLPAQTLATPRWSKAVRLATGNGDLSEVSPAVRGAIENEASTISAVLKESQAALGKARAVLNPPAAAGRTVASQENKR